MVVRACEEAGDSGHIDQKWWFISIQHLHYSIMMLVCDIVGAVGPGNGIWRFGVLRGKTQDDWPCMRKHQHLRKLLGKGVCVPEFTILFVYRAADMYASNDDGGFGIRGGHRKRQ